MKKKLVLALLLAVMMAVMMMPAGAFAAVPAGDRPSNPDNRLVIGILNDNRAGGDDEFPNEPSVTGYTYYYLQSNLSLSSSLFSTIFSNNAGNYIDTSAFWNDARINENAAGNAFGYYAPTGLDLANDPFFRDGLENVLDEDAIIQAWLDEKGSSDDPADYDLLYYVLKYETGWSSGFHLDAKVIPINTVTLSYDANKPAGANTDITLPSSRVLTPPDTVTVAGLSAADDTLTAGGLTYEFTGWNTKADGSGVSYAPSSSITVTDNTILYAQWRIENTYTVSWRNYNGNLLHSAVYDYGDPVNAAGDYPYSNPTRPNTSTHEYTFNSWALTSGSYNPATGITGDLTYTAQYDSTEIFYTATVNVILDGSFDADGNLLFGSTIDIDEVDAAADNELYLKATDGSGSYIPLTRDSEGVYSAANVHNGSYYIYLHKGSSYVQVDA